MKTLSPSTPRYGGYFSKALLKMVDDMTVDHPDFSTCFCLEMLMYFFMFAKHHPQKHYTQKHLAYQLNFPFFFKKTKQKTI